MAAMKGFSFSSAWYFSAFIFYSHLLCIIMLITNVDSGNKYSAEANKKFYKPEGNVNLQTLQKPFRMAKLNTLWAKAQQRLTETKLKSLFSDLKIQDKEEIAWKQVKTEGLDKEGLKEAQLRKKLTGIMNSYGLLEHFEDITDPKLLKQHKAFNDASDDYINKSLFKDKKLNKLWLKAEKAGFTPEELSVLKEEFMHHQDKIDQYYTILKDVESPNDTEENSVDDKLEKFNRIERAEEGENVDKSYLHKANLLRERHKDIRNGYDRLHRIAAKGPSSKEFIEPRVEGLWRMAIEANFTPEELESLRGELMHYENRVLKLRHMQAEAAVGSDRRQAKEAQLGAKTDGIRMMEDNVKKQMRKVEKLHLELEAKIMQRHVEL
ncbi:alpha-2-macroglobulin receptor-associated protein [Bacillus rossius redtenbacheri]|uniref:alpha-2-macroglobulin receptor-associated protein n=1 Tax=Bacillus rossius redtenbacheri TaxID=93214 RepID=UPI002FDDDE25